MSRNTKTNSVLELEEQNVYETCKEPLTCRHIVNKLATNQL